MRGMIRMGSKQESLCHDSPRPKALLQANLQVGAEEGVFKKRGKGQGDEESSEELRCPQKSENLVVAGHHIEKTPHSPHSRPPESLKGSRPR